MARLCAITATAGNDPDTNTMTGMPTRSAFVHACEHLLGGQLLPCA